jgi:hypothetical protein
MCERNKPAASPSGKEEQGNCIVNPRFTLADKSILYAVI